MVEVFDGKENVGACVLEVGAPAAVVVVAAVGVLLALFEGKEKPKLGVADVIGVTVAPLPALPPRVVEEDDTGVADVDGAELAVDPEFTAADEFPKLNRPRVGIEEVAAASVFGVDVETAGVKLRLKGAAVDELLPLNVFIPVPEEPGANTAGADEEIKLEIELFDSDALFIAPAFNIASTRKSVSFSDNRGLMTELEDGDSSRFILLCFLFAVLVDETILALPVVAMGVLALRGVANRLETWDEVFEGVTISSNSGWNLDEAMALFSSCTIFFSFF